MKEWHFRIGVHHLRGLIDAFEAGKSYADLAEAVVQGLWPRVQADFAAKHGACPGRGAVLLGMGSLGAGRLNAGSDLDLILIYDAEGVDLRRPPPAADAHLLRAPDPGHGHRAVGADRRGAALRGGRAAAPLGPGRGRWRPRSSRSPGLSGNRGLDLGTPGPDPRTGAGGRASLAAEVEDFRRQILALKGPGARGAGGRGRDAGAAGRGQAARGAWEAKNGPGRLMDIELCAQWAALVAANPARQVERQIASKGALPPEDQAVLLEAYRLLWRLQAGSKLLGDRGLDLASLGEGGRVFLLRETGAETVEALQGQIGRMVSLAESVIARQFPGQG
jgi:glutamate-ammonia-ligase adenylyltransferase